MLQVLTKIIGVVGLAIGQKLAQKFPSKSMYLVDRNPSAGQETRYAVIYLCCLKYSSHSLV